ncbi:MAG: hypothetical protein EPN82_04515 [Bacteroidetes bacterium]|nr:MAG: hypothetical protein EPN82_04515 [Bacteroidota bacterium]
MKKSSKYFLLIVLLVVLTQNIYFDIYRGSAFNIMPHDDYSHYLLYLVGENEGWLAEPPYTYRILSVSAAIPFYYVLPVYRFTNLEGKSDNQLRALEALALVFYLSIIICSIFIYLITKKRLGGSEPASIIAMLVSYLLLRQTGIYSIDPIAIMIICLAVYYMRNVIVFPLLMILSIGFNEKILIIFTLLMVSRLIIKKEKFNFISLSPLISLVIYFIIRILFHVPGNEGQVQPATYVSGLMSNIGYTFSLKGLFLNILPSLLTASLYYMAIKGIRGNNETNNHYFMKVDIVPLIGIFIISHLINVDYNIGRVSLHCFPLYLPLATIWLVKLLTNEKFEF